MNAAGILVSGIIPALFLGLGTEASIPTCLAVIGATLVSLAK